MNQVSKSDIGGGELQVKRVEVFAVATGAYGNVGDAVIRRRALSWLDGVTHRSWHVYVGNAPGAWIEQLQLPNGTHIYRSSDRARWVLRLMAGRGRRVLLLDPGEVPLANHDVPAEIVTLMLCTVLRARRSVIIRPPRGIGRRRRAGVMVHKAASRLSDLVLWRNEESLQTIGVGELAPDTAFGEPSIDGASWDGRDLVVVSLRGRRPHPGQTVLGGVARLAEAERLKVVTASQVREDEPRNASLANELEDIGAGHVAWHASSDLEHEIVLRELYARARYVVSDRLHVLILAALAGAVPLEYVPSPRPKVDVTFRQIGVTDVSLDSESHDADQFVLHAIQSANQREELASAIARARSDLNNHVRRARTAIDSM